MDLCAMALSGLIGTQHLEYTPCKIMLNSGPGYPESAVAIKK